MTIILVMRYRTPSSSKQRRGQFFTPEPLAARIADFFTTRGGEWLELGVGTGRLMEACVSARSPQRFVGVDIDQELVSSAQVPAVASIKRVNVLAPRELKNALQEETFICSVGNPPFGHTNFTPAALKRLDELCPGLVSSGPWARIDLYFVLESLSRLRSPGEAAFIVGSPLLADPALRTFRYHLISSASEIECYELPNTTFESAEVTSHVLVIRFGTNRNNCRITVGRLAGNDYQVVEQRKVASAEALERMDFAHYELAEFTTQLVGGDNVATLEQLGASIVRGSRSKQQFSELGISNFHTTDFPQYAQEVSFEGACDQGFNLAEMGNILVPRVGTRCLARQVIVRKGQRPYTEAVYRLSLPKQVRTRVFDWMSSERGIEWRLLAARGSCAKHLTVANLLKMPVQI